MIPRFLVTGVGRWDVNLVPELVVQEMAWKQLRFLDTVSMSGVPVDDSEILSIAS